VAVTVIVVQTIPGARAATVITGVTVIHTNVIVIIAIIVHRDTRWELRRCHASTSIRVWATATAGMGYRDKDEVVASCRAQADIATACYCGGIATAPHVIAASVAAVY
jgi:hypothetical protein